MPPSSQALSEPAAVRRVREHRRAGVGAALLSAAASYAAENGASYVVAAVAQDGTSSITEKVMPSVCTQCGSAV